MGEGRSMSDEYSDYENRIVSKVEEHGWFGTHVFDPKGDAPGFTYSIGFTKTLNCPEFIIFGLNNELMHSMLWNIFRDIEGGVTPHDGRVWSNLLEGFDCVIKSVHPDNIRMNYLNSAKWFWDTHLGNSEPLEAYQVVWPGAVSGEFPWDDDCDPYIIEKQPPLYLPGLPEY